MKVKVPPQVRIGCHDYNICFNKHLWHDDKLAGSVNHRTHMIQIDPAFQLSELDATLIHEIIHIVVRIFSCQAEEADIDRLSEGMGEFLLNNLGIEFDWSNISEIVDK